MEPTSLNQPQKKKSIIYIAIVVFILIVLFIVNSKGEKTTFFTNPLLYVVAPLKDNYSQLNNYVSRLLDKYLFLTEVFEENIKLKDEIVTLYEKNNALIEEKKELLRRAENLKSIDQYFIETNTSLPFVEAKVISKNFTGFTSSIIIDKGSDD
ncbi:MAG: hypothetical protein HQK84_11155, partial [Nitrospinae bacterium]|nr:hypothetical protein [Nitrospinota bacterium]